MSTSPGRINLATALKESTPITRRRPSKLTPLGQAVIWGIAATVVAMVLQMVFTE